MKAPSGSDWPAWLAHRAEASKSEALRDYYGSLEWDPGQAIADTPLVAVDLETSGLDPRRHAILSIGVLPFTLQGIRLADRRQWLLRPPAGFSGESVAFHHITHGDIEQAADFEAVLPALLDTLAGRMMVVHYHPLERRFLDHATRMRLGETLKCPMIDTMELEARRHRQGWRSRWRALLGRTPTSLRLNDSRARYGLPPYEGHRAVLDALATAELLQAQIQHAYSPSTPLESLWV